MSIGLFKIITFKSKVVFLFHGFNDLTVNNYHVINLQVKIVKNTYQVINLWGKIVIKSLKTFSYFFPFQRSITWFLITYTSARDDEQRSALPPIRKVSPPILVLFLRKFPRKVFLAIFPSKLFPKHHHFPII